MDGINLIKAVSSRATLEGDWQMDGVEERGDGRSGERLVGSVEVTVEVADVSDIPEAQTGKSESKQQFVQQISEQQVGKQNSKTLSEPYIGERYLHACLLDPDGGEVDRIFPLPLQERLQFRMQAETPILWNAELPQYYELELEIYDGGEDCLERRTQPVAFCEIETRDGKLYVNRREAPVRAAVFSGQKTDLPFTISDSGQQMDKAVRSKDSGKRIELVWLREFLTQMKRNFRNVLLTSAEQSIEILKAECIRYGIYLLDAEDLSRENVPDSNLRATNTPASAACTEEKCQLEKSRQRTNPDVELQIVQTGVLIENHSIFLNMSEYELYYEVTLRENSFCAVGNLEHPEEQAVSEKTDRTGDSENHIVPEIREKSDSEVRTYRKFGVLQADVPPQTSWFVEVPFEPLPHPGRYRFYVALRLKKDTVWAQTGYVVAEQELELAKLY